MKTNPYAASFPFEFKTVDKLGNTIEQHFAFGLTKREFFSALAMHALIANPTTTGENAEGIGRGAVKAAELLISALNEPTQAK